MIKNSFGVRIRKICASCVHRKEHTEQYRMCEKHKKQVLSVFTCDSWELQQRFLNAGKGDGRVKSKAYMLEYMRSYYEKKDAEKAKRESKA